MLECQTLLLRSWTAPAGAAAGVYRKPGPGSTRDLVDPVTGQRVGLVRWQTPESGFWRAWLARPRLMVHEVDDEPLVFTIQRLWALTTSWEVCDADAHRVAMLRRDWILDRYGDCLAWLDRRPPADGLRFCGRDGRELARLSRMGRDLELAFVHELQGEPFVKMALLAAALCGRVER